MFRIGLLSFSLLISTFCFSQKKIATADTTKKVIFTDIVKVDSTNRFDLYKKAVKWVENQKFAVQEEDPYGGKITAKGKMTVYTDKGVLAKPNGEFAYDVMIDVKDGKYRYTFSNFIYTYIKMDRNYRYVPVKGSKPIEDGKAAGWKKQWGKDKVQVTDKINQYISSLKESMKYVAPVKLVEKPKETW
jgi:hypothetical protein